MHGSFPIVLFMVLCRNKPRDHLFYFNQIFFFCMIPSYISLFQNRGRTTECDDRIKWKLHTFVFHMEPLLSFRTIDALKSKTRRDRNLRIATICNFIVNKISCQTLCLEKFLILQNVQYFHANTQTYSISTQYLLCNICYIILS